MAKVLIITPALAAFLSSCLEIGSEGSDGCGAGDEAEMEAACELVGELRSWADSGLGVQITFEPHWGDTSADPVLNEADYDDNGNLLPGVDHEASAT